jgi:general stress protein YciG
LVNEYFKPLQNGQTILSCGSPGFGFEKPNLFLTSKTPIMSSQAITPRNQDGHLSAELHPAGSKKNGTSHRGFAAMSADQQRQIASKGGEAVSKNREHMAEIGKKGGEIVSQNRRHMSEIGRKGGEASKASRNR